MKFLYPFSQDPFSQKCRPVPTKLHGKWGFTQGNQILFFILFLTMGQISFGQKKKVNLEDVKIQGEGLNNSRISLSKKDRTDVEKHLKIRKDFREEILSDLPSSIQLKRIKAKKASQP